MKHVILSFVMVLASPFAIAQTNEVTTSNGETENPVMPRTEVTTSNGETENPIMPKIEWPVSTTDGSVAAFAADEMIVLKTAQGESASFVLSPTATYLDMGGREVDASWITEGATVQVTAEENGEQRVATRIVVHG